MTRKPDIAAERAKTNAYLASLEPRLFVVVRGTPTTTHKTEVINCAPERARTTRKETAQ